MSIRSLFPEYPFYLRPLPNSNVKFGTRRLYVDLPWQAYNFLFLMMSEALEADLTKTKVQKEWKKYLQENIESLTFKGKPILSIFLKSSSLTRKKMLMLRVNWKLFNDFFRREV